MVETAGKNQSRRTYNSAIYPNRLILSLTGINKLASMKGQPKWAMLKQECIRQSQTFAKWHKANQHSTFHSSHYDWWAFPIDKPSSYGQKYQVTPTERDTLIADPEFIQALRTNALLVCWSWGYDLQAGRALGEASREQRWQKWPIRLYKMSNSLQLFEQWDLHRNSIIYGMWLIKKGEGFTYMGRHLDEYYVEWHSRISKTGVRGFSEGQGLQKQREHKKQGGQQTRPESKTEVPYQEKRWQKRIEYSKEQLRKVEMGKETQQQRYQSSLKPSLAYGSRNVNNTLARRNQSVSKTMLNPQTNNIKFAQKGANYHQMQLQHQTQQSLSTKNRPNYQYLQGVIDQSQSRQY